MGVGTHLPATTISVITGTRNIGQENQLDTNANQNMVPKPQVRFPFFLHCKKYKIVNKFKKMLCKAYNFISFLINQCQRILKKP